MRRASPTQISDAAGFAEATKVSRETIERLNLYESLLKVWQKRINLVASATLDDVWHRHFHDSAQLVPHLPAGARSVVDLGSGAGFPGMVLALVLADRSTNADTPGAGAGAGAGGQAGGRLVGGRGIRVALVESDQRKAAFLREVARQTGVAVEILSTRIENPETRIKLGQPDVVTARALAPLALLLDLAAPLFGASTVGLFLKGRNAAAEVEAAASVWSFAYDLLPSVTDPEARIVVVRQLRRR